MTAPERAWLGRIPYLDALEAQRARREAVIEGRSPEALWALEHDPVITTGRRLPEGLPSAEALEARGISLVRTERGGLATWHGPGQLVVYVIVDVVRRGLGAKRLVEALEQAIIGWLGIRGVVAVRRDGYPGVWVGSRTSPAGLDKICAMGLHFRRGVSMHGLALNLTPVMDAYRLFTPCGVSDAGVTRLSDHAGATPSPEEAAMDVLNAVLDTIERASGVDAGGALE